MTTQRYGKLRSGRKSFAPSFAQTLRNNNAATSGLEKQYGDLREAKGMPMPGMAEVGEYKPRVATPKEDGELSELQEQIRVVKWWDANCHLYKLPPVALFAIPNGGGRGLIEAANMKRSGVRAGVEDLFLSVPNNIYHGMFLEMKAGKGTVEVEQSAMHFFHRRSGYCVQVAWEHATAIEYIEQYLGETVS